MALGAVAAVLALGLGLSLLGLGAEDSATAHHTVYLVSPGNNSYTSQNNDTLAVRVQPYGVSFGNSELHFVS